jgi:hypothetical protein
VSITASTTLETFFGSIVTRLSSGIGVTFATGRIFVVDKLRLQNAPVPNIQLEPISLSTLGEYAGVNAMALEYKAHAVVKVEQDIDNRSTRSLLANAPMAGVLPRGAFPLAVQIASTLQGWEPDATWGDAQVLLKVEGGIHDEVEGLTTAYAHFRTMIRVLNDG